MTDRILSKIQDQPTACTLLALRAHLIEAEKWDEEIHGPAYRSKFSALCARWGQA